ncbi:MAG: hypothetical protein HQ556_08395 [Candidatus Marinimicrobia bacterium]|nr:hypothetical protein [Candidatus Neomarinimicrobiota bacterium]
MFRLLGSILLVTSVAFSQNMIDKGVWKLGGSVGIDKYTDENYNRTLYHISPELDYFINNNVGFGMQVWWYKNTYDDWDYGELSFFPSITFVTEKPIYPLYISTGLSYYTDSDAEKASDYLLGWFAETGMVLFLNEHVAIIPKYSMHKDSDTRSEAIQRLSLSLAYFFNSNPE